MRYARNAGIVNRYRCDVGIFLAGLRILFLVILAVAKLYFSIRPLSCTMCCRSLKCASKLLSRCVSLWHFRKPACVFGRLCFFSNLCLVRETGSLPLSTLRPCIITSSVSVCVTYRVPSVPFGMICTLLSFHHSPLWHLPASEGGRRCFTATEGFSLQALSFIIALE